MFWMYFVIYFIFIGAQLNEYLHFCRKRNEEMKVNPDVAQNDDDWEDDDIPDMSYEDTDDTSSITRDASISDKVIDYDEAVSHKKHLIKGKLTNRKKQWILSFNNGNTYSKTR